MKILSLVILFASTGVFAQIGQGLPIKASDMEAIQTQVNKNSTYQVFSLHDINTATYFGTGINPPVVTSYIKFFLSGVHQTNGNSIIKRADPETLFEVNNDDGYTKIVALKDIIVNGNINVVPGGADGYLQINTNSSFYATTTKTCSHSGHWCVMQINNVHLNQGQYIRFYSEHDLQTYQGMNIVAQEK